MVGPANPDDDRAVRQREQGGLVGMPAGQHPRPDDRTAQRRRDPPHLIGQHAPSLAHSTPRARGARAGAVPGIGPRRHGPGWAARSVARWHDWPVLSTELAEIAGRYGLVPLPVE